MPQVTFSPASESTSKQNNFGPRWYGVVLQATVSITFAARGWLTWRWDSPLRTLVWQEAWWTEPLQQIFGVSWQEFAKHSEPTLTTVLEMVGIFLMVAATVPWIVTRKPFRWTRWILVLAGLILALDAVGRWVNADFEFAMSIEHALQVVAPFALLVALRYGSGRVLWVMIAIATSGTFCGHGLYAVGFHPVPLVYQTMTMKLLGCDLETGLLFLKIVGLLDFTAVVGLWIGFVRPGALTYMVIWGAATSLARTLAHDAIDPWFAETLVRTAHWSLPLLLLCMPSARLSQPKIS